MNTLRYSLGELMQENKIATRFAPSPSGHLHLGHAYSAMFAENAAREQDGRFLLRMENIDQRRCKPVYEKSIKDDLEWLGLNWDDDVFIQSQRIEKHKEENPQVKIIVVDPRKTQTCAIADLHLQILPGTDVILFNAIARWLIEKKKIDKKFIKNHTVNFEACKESAFQLSLRKAAELCGISIDDIRTAASYIGNAKAFISMWTMGLNQSVIGVSKNLALLNLSLLTGQIGKPGAGPFSLTGQPNAMGGREVGGMASLLAAHRDLGNPRHRAEVAEFWGGKEISGEAGYTATEMFDALESGKMKAIWIICTNPIVSLPNANKIERALKNASFVVVQDISHNSETTEFADLLLPAAGWLEKEGTMCLRIMRIRPAPANSAAMTKSSSRSDKNLPRTSLANRVHSNIAIMMVIAK